MTLPASGAISFNAINVELGQAGTTSANINQASYRTLAGVPSGTIALSNFYGKSNELSLTISSNQTNLNLGTYASGNGWNGSTKLTVTISPGIYISSNSVGTPALTVNGSFPGGVSLVNNGTIVGMGGSGRPGSSYNNGGPGGGYSGGSAGGLGLSVSSAITITNNNIIAGGGGGGGGGSGTWIFLSKGLDDTRGGGGGGGQSSLYDSPAGFGAASSPGTISSGGAGAPRQPTGGGSYAGAGGAGGSWGSTGSSGENGPAFSGGTRVPASGGLSGGGAVSGNSNITWVTTGTRYGGIS